jgi:ABC-2 type transport system ATP-binding protein
LLKIALTGDHPPDWRAFGEVVETDGANVSLRIPRSQVPATTARLLAELPVADLSVAEPPLEHVIDQAYRDKMTR